MKYMPVPFFLFDNRKKVLKNKVIPSRKGYCHRNKNESTND